MTPGAGSGDDRGDDDRDHDHAPEHDADPDRDPGSTERNPGEDEGESPGEGDGEANGDGDGTGIDTDDPSDPDPGDDLELPPDDEVDAVTEDILEEVERRRHLRGAATVAVAAIGIAFSLYQVWIAARGFVFEFSLPLLGTYRLTALAQLQVRAIHVTFALVLAFLLYPGLTRENRLVSWLGRIPTAVRGRLGTHPVADATDRLAGIVAWIFVDRDGDRVTPADVGLIALALLPAAYYATAYDEITDIIRVRGLRGAGALGDVYPLLEPLGVGPLATWPFAYLMGVLAILLVLEATRRSLGLLLTGLVGTFIVYGRYGHLIPRDAPGIGLLAVSELRWDQIVQNLWYTVEGILGLPVGVSVRFIYIFILFGAFLEMSGAGKWFIDLAYAVTGTRKGGPAKASVVSSGFMGMISGSSVGNTVTTGALTIPLMKRSGYSPSFAGAVEASVSSGGQILPPVMGAAAFLIVEFTGTPYREVIIAATLPAIMFFFGMWVMVHFEAAKRGIGGLPRSELLDLWPHLARGWFYLVPLGLLLYYIVIARLSIGRAGWLTILAIVALVALVAAYDRATGPYLLGAVALALAGTAASLATTGVTPLDLLWSAGVPADAPGPLPLRAAVVGAVAAFEPTLVAIGVLFLLARPRGSSPLLELDDAVDGAARWFDDRAGREIATTRAGRFATFILKSLDGGARTATVIVIAVAAAGVIPGIINLTGLGGSLRALILAVSGGSLVLLLLLAGLASIIVGMGMPTTVMYIIIIVLLGPTIPEFGIAILAAHLFVLYLGLMADVTPPVAVAAYAAAGIAKADAFETGIQAFLLSLNKILVPFAFVFAPGILLLRGEGRGEGTILGWAELTDPAYVVPEVLIPVVAVFAGVYALAIAIIGFYKTDVSRLSRSGFGLAAVFLSIPGMVLMPLGTGFGRFGLTVTLFTPTADLLMRGVGGGLFVLLLVRNARRARDREVSPGTVQAGTD